ncbi:hypothetical protein [Mesorhizobium sp. Z1-4]|uniref:hypothetical protein n=1 Tax=Mesorhizobium sp. Z1-4 TaxID=2448478 RepID=UPI000FD89803|nr:hypothetical protein [Mesorhizobium sp. Z1-4]
MTQPNAKRPGHLGDGRAAKKDRSEGPIASENSRDSRIGQAAAWYAAHRLELPRPLVPNLARRFDLTSAEAAKALARAGRAA